jgi:hypothetical protein
LRYTVTDQTVGGACSTYWKYDKRLLTFRRKDLNAKTHLENLNVTEGIILKWTLELGFEGSECSQLVQDMAQWRAVMSHH